MKDEELRIDPVPKPPSPPDEDGEGDLDPPGIPPKP